MKRFYRSPALHFLLIGVVLFALQTVAGGTPQRMSAAGLDRSPIVVTADDIAELRRRYQESTPGEPDRAAYDYMIEQLVNDELLYREALALGMDRGDTTVRYRLIEKMEYLGEAEVGDDADEVVARAIELGLSRSDPMVRNALIQKYSMLVRFARVVPPDEVALRAYYEANKGRYGRPARATITHVFLSRQERGAQQARADAERLLEELSSKNVDPAAAIAEGDVFLMGHRFSNHSPRAVAQLFGEDFAEQVVGSQAEGWIGPVRSSFGYHAVFVEDYSPAGTLTFEEVRSQVLKAVEDQTREAQLRDKLEALRARSVIEIEWGEFEPKEGG